MAPPADAVSEAAAMAPMPRLYRDVPLNAIWEGPGHVQCLDVLRSMRTDPGTVDALLDEIRAARGGDRRLDALVRWLEHDFKGSAAVEERARWVVERLALAIQGALLVRHAPQAVADASCASRLAGDGGLAFGTLPAGLDFDAIIVRSLPKVEG